MQTLRLASLVTTCLVCLLHSPASAAITKAFVVTTDFDGTTGGLSVVGVGNRSVQKDVATVSNDPVVRWYGGLVYVVNRFQADNIQVVDPAQSYATVRNISTGNGTNPQDICFLSPTKAYVSRLGSASLLILNPSAADGQPMSSISLAAFADADGLPEAARMIRVGRWLFVACQRITNFSTTNPSVVVVVDTQADTVKDCNPGTPGIQGIPLIGRNPATAFAYDPAGNRLLIGNAGDPADASALDGGIEAIDPVSLVNLGVLITEQELGGNLSDVVWGTATRSFAIVFDASFNSSLVAWNPSTGLKLGAPLYSPGGFSLADAELNDRGELYVCNNSFFGTPGVVILDAATGAILAGPLDTGEPPFSLTFDQETGQVLGVEQPTARNGSLELWPNPASGEAQLTLRVDGAVDAAFEVFDLAGRKVWEGNAAPRTTHVRWDLRDLHGRHVESGIYLARGRVGRSQFVRRVVVIR